MLYEFIFEPAPRLRHHRRKVGFGVIFDRASQFCLPAHVCFAPKATVATGRATSVGFGWTQLQSRATVAHLVDRPTISRMPRFAARAPAKPAGASRNRRRSA